MKIIETCLTKTLIKFVVADDYGNKQEFKKSLMTIEPKNEAYQLLMFASGLRELGDRLKHQVQNGTACNMQVGEFGRQKTVQNFGISDDGKVVWDSSSKIEYTWLKIYEHPKSGKHIASVVESNMVTEEIAKNWIKQEEGPDEVKAVGPFYDPKSRSFGDFHTSPGFRPKNEVMGKGFTSYVEGNTPEGRG